MSSNEYLNPPSSGWSAAHPSNQFSSYGSPPRSYERFPSGVDGLAMVRAAEKHAHEMGMVKDLLVSIINALDIQQHTLDDIYEMLDVYIMGKEDESE